MKRVNSCIKLILVLLVSVSLTAIILYHINIDTIKSWKSVIFNKASIQSKDEIPIIYRVLYHGEMIAPILLKELFDVVNEFVFVESELTFSGINDGFFYEKEITNKINEKYFENIKYFQINQTETKHFTDPWKREIFVTNYFQKYIINNYCKQNKSFILYISDIDEILNRNLIDTFTKKKILYQKLNDNIYHLEQEFFKYNFKCQLNYNWTKAVIMNDNSFGCKTKKYPDIHGLRTGHSHPRIHNGGYHISSALTVDGMLNKYKSISEEQWLHSTKYHNKKWIQHIFKHCIDEIDRKSRRNSHIIRNESYINHTMPEWIQDFHQILLQAQSLA